MSRCVLDYRGGLRRSGVMARALLASIVAVLTGMLVSLAPQVAEACACCDGTTSRTPVGWSKTGRTLLVHNEDWTACEQTVQLELWRVNQKRPAGCYDLFGNADRKIKCVDVKPNESEADPQKSSIVRRFSPAEPIDSRWVRSWRRYRPPASDEEHDLDTHTVGVEVWTGTGWHEIWQGPVAEARYPGAQDEPPLSAPLRVEVWPTPDGSRAALLVHNRYGDPGTGHFFDDVHWVDLPEATRALPDLRKASVSWRSESIPLMDKPSVWQERRLSARENARGLRRYREGKFGDAAVRFIEALRFNPGNVMARYNLACVLALEGLTERSLSMLEQLAKAADDGSCDKCRGRIERAAEDDDFKSLRSDTRFKAIVGS